MSDEVKRKFFYLYFGFQCLANVLNFLVYLSIVTAIIFIWCLGASFWWIFLMLLFFTICYIFYAKISVSAAKSSIKIIKKQNLTKFEKFAVYAFALTTISFYILMIIFPDIPQGIVSMLEFLPSAFYTVFDFIRRILSAAFFAHY